MKKTMPALIAFAALLGAAACNKANQQTADTSTVPATDTVSGHAVPTTDTVVKTTTTDTLKGQVNEDSVKAKLDSTKAKKDSMAAKKSTKKKSAKKY